MRFKKKILAAAAVLLSLVGCQEADAPKAAPPTAVKVIQTRAEDVPLYKDFVGTTAGYKDISIRARVEGFVLDLHFLEGSKVEKDDLLYTIESKPYEEQVAISMSDVAEAETMLAQSKGYLDRIEPLAAMNAVSQSDLDEARAKYEASVAGLDAAQAGLRAAQIELGYTRIKAPIAGIIGKTLAKVGDFVGRDPNPVILNQVSQVDPILVTFFITEAQYLEVAPFISLLNSPEGEDLDHDLSLILIDDSVYPYKGKGDFIDRSVDTSTGALLVQASFPNPDELLRPGQSVKVNALVRIAKDGILIPQRCVIELQGMYSVFVINKNNTVESRAIEVGPKVGSNWLVREGLAPNERVIYEGLQKVRDGVTVQATEVPFETLEGGAK
jgi:membrane fusion protein (multidrug efflux system)